jgi:hypothetical protein
MTVLWDLNRARGVLIVHTGPEPSDRRNKKLEELTEDDLALLRDHLDTALQNLASAVVMLTGRYER